MIHHDTIQCSTMQHNAIQCNTIQCHTIRCTTAQHRTVQDSAMNFYNTFGYHDMYTELHSCIALHHMMQNRTFKLPATAIWNLS